jgi:hypothetical protein
MPSLDADIAFVPGGIALITEPRSLKVTLGCDGQANRRGAAVFRWFGYARVHHGEFHGLSYFLGQAPSFAAQASSSISVRPPWHAGACFNIPSEAECLFIAISQNV